MAYLLDSDWLILRLADRPSAVRLIRQLAPVGLAVSVITYMEVSKASTASRTPRRPRSGSTISWQQ